MIDNHRHLLSSEHTGNAQLITRAELGIVRQILVDALVGDIEHLEETGVVEQTYIHATTVGAVVVHNLIAAIFQFGLTHEVLQHGDVLNLTDADEDGTLGRRALDFHLADGIGHVVLFLPILGTIPLASAFGREFLVIDAIVVDGVEQVLQVIEHDAIHQVAAILFGLLLVFILGHCQRRQQCHQRQGHP